MSQLGKGKERRETLGRYLCPPVLEGARDGGEDPRFLATARAVIPQSSIFFCLRIIC